MIAHTKWPEYIPEKCKEDTVEIAVQINGKVRERMVIERDMPQQEVLLQAKTLPRIGESIDGKQLVKELYVPGKLVNLVVK